MKLIFSLSVLLCFITSYGQDYNARILTTENGLPSDQIYYTFEDSKGFIWIGTKNGVVRWDSKYFEYYTIKDGLSNNEIVGIMEDSKGRVWFLSFNNTVSYYQNGKIYNQQLDKRLENIKPSSGSNFIQFKDWIYYSEKSGNLLSFHIESLAIKFIDSSKNSDLFRYKDKLFVNSIEQYPNHEKHYLAIISEVGSENFYTEKLRTIGLNYLDKNKNIFDTYINKRFNIGQLKMLSSNSIIKKNNNSLLINNGNNIILLFKNSFISKLYTENIKKIYLHKNQLYYINNQNLIKHYPSNKIFIHTQNVGTLYNVAQNENESLITFSKNIYKTSNPSQKVEIDFMPINQHSHLSLTNQKKAFGLNLKFSTIHNNSIFLSHYLGIFKKTNNNFVQLNEKRTYLLFFDSKYQLWYNTSDSLFRCKYYHPIIKNEEPIVLENKFKLLINDIKEDKQGNMIFATNNGVYIYHPETRKKYWLNDSNFLSSNECNRVELDPQDQSLWVSTFNGLNHIRYFGSQSAIRFELINRFFKNDGLYANEINDFLIQGDSIWIATPKGLNLLTNKYFTPDTISLPLYFNKLFVNEQLRNFKKSVDLKSEENNIRIDFSAIYFQRRDRLLIQYKLITNGDTTIKYITENTIQLLALKDGTYELQLFAYDKDYPYIKSEVITLKFNIKPPFYKAWWFWTFVFFIGLILIGIYLYRRLLTRKNAMIKEVEMQSKLKEYSLKGLQNQMNPHFVFNSLNTILHFISKKQEREAYDYLAMFSGLIRKILENGRMEKIQIKNELTFLKEYTELEMIRYENKFDIEYKLNIDIEDMDAEIPTMLIQPIIENAIKHGVSNLIEKRGLIIIEAYIQNEDYLFIRISDNGIGKHTEKKSHTSTALNLIKERLELYAREGRYGKFKISITPNGATAELLIPI